ncbi:membrane dipeptidase [Brevundimonas sp.]|uniref:dipeptidase n=1 Tax=Brevundimonas sp. TaxID=1871086 RepID=UPI00289A17B8|nr:membrane dipeptidase [Brevundimonas sp.]
MNRREAMGAVLGSAAIVSFGTAIAQTAPLGRYVVDALAIGGAGSVDGPEVLAAGMDALVLDLTIFPRALPQATEALAAWTARVGETGTALHIIRDGRDFQKARADNKLGVVIACQDASILGPSVISYSDQNLENLRTMHGSGLRILQLTHNERTAAGDGFIEPHDGGLSLLGARVVEEMGRLGGLIDLSHCSDRTTIEAIGLSNGPVAITHAGCRALNSSMRNKTDEAIRALADKGGFFGVFMMSRWLTDRDTSSVEDVVDHIDHVVKIGGVEVAGFGSDQPAMGDDSPQTSKVARLAEYQARNLGRPGAEPLHGHVTCADMDGPDRMTVLAKALNRRGYAPSDIDKIVGGNFIRIFSDAASNA